MTVAALRKPVPARVSDTVQWTLVLADGAALTNVLRVVGVAI